MRKKSKGLIVAGLTTILVLLLVMMYSNRNFVVIREDPSKTWMDIPGFPEAEGFGSLTPGGRINPLTNETGKVIHVTNLNNDGPGSLREAITTSGPRIIVFDVGGVIELERALSVTEPFCTIAGQTAPGDGICIKNQDLRIEAPNVIVRYLRVRPGDDLNHNPENIDGITIAGSPPQDVYNVIIDHCSMSWSQDETFSTWYGAHDITLQWCILSEGLSHAHHPEGEHSKALLIGDASDNITIHHNLLAHHTDRHPFIKAGAVDYFNNINYNYIHPTTIGRGEYNNSIPARVNLQGNLYIQGADLDEYIPAIQIYEHLDPQDYPQIYLNNNIGPDASGQDAFDDAIVGYIGDGFPSAKYYSEITSLYLKNTPFSGRPNVSLSDPWDAYNMVLNFSGANLMRDAVDLRVISSVIGRNGTIIDSPDEVGGYPSYSVGTPIVDSDYDGIPDDWENLHGLDPNDAADNWSDDDENGYIALEEYINSLVEIH